MPKCIKTISVNAMKLFLSLVLFYVAAVYPCYSL